MFRLIFRLHIILSNSYGLAYSLALEDMNEKSPDYIYKKFKVLNTRITWTKSQRIEYGLKSKISECRIQSLCYHALLCTFKSKGILKENMSLKENGQWYIESLGLER